MTRDEVKRLLGWTLANFPTMQERDLKPTAELWHRMLADIPYEVAEKALMSVLSKAKYFPTVAEIREAVAQITAPQLPSAIEAWGEVVEAIKRYGSYRENEALASLSPPVRQVVKWIGYRELCLSEEPDVIRGQFRMAYEQYANRIREEEVLPPEVKQLIGSVIKQLPEKLN